MLRIYLKYACEEETVLVLLERVNEAQRLAARELRESQAALGTLNYCCNNE
jgi:hypothetical protein